MKNNKFIFSLQKSPLFLQMFFKNPLKTGAIAPSSKELATQMAKLTLKYADNQSVIELGPGTGVITEAILKQGLPENRLFLLEYEEQFVNRLQKHFPKVLIKEGDASNLSRIVKETQLEKPVSVIVSSLPLQPLFPTAKQKILQEIYDVLPSGGYYIQFTYGFLRTMTPFKNKEEVKQVWFNFPPARIYVFKK